MMRIGIVNSFYPPWRGGAETYASNLSTQLVMRGHDVEVLCASPPRKPGSYGVNGVRVTCLPITGWLYGTPIVSRLPQRLLQLRADLVHAGFPSPYNAFCASLISRVTQTPSLLTWHNDLPPVTAAAKALVYAHDNLVLPAYLRHFRAIISTSSKYARSSKILRKHLGRVRIIPNGVDCQRFHPNAKPDRIKLTCDLEKRKVILFVGALTRWHCYKGLDVLIKAFALATRRRNDMVLMVVGDGNMKSTYQRLCMDLDLAEKTIFVGNVSDQDLPSHYAASDLLILPSKDRSEGFGLTILEANACGKPAIGSNVGGIPDAIQAGFNGLLVPPNNPESLSQSIIRLVDDEHLRIEMGKNARAFAEEHDWSKVAQATERIYRETFEQSAREPQRSVNHPEHDAYRSNEDYGGGNGERNG